MKSITSDRYLDPVDICTLSPEELAERSKWIRSEILSHAIGKGPSDGGVAIEVADVPGMRDRVDEWIELERDCCSSIHFERRASADPERVRIDIQGIDPNASFLATIPDLVDSAAAGAAALDSAPPATRSGFRRFLRAGGLGAMASVFTFCVLPMLVVSLVGALFGGAAASLPLSELDDPLWIGLGTAVAAAGIWWWTGRNRRVCDE